MPTADDVKPETPTHPAGAPSLFLGRWRSTNPRTTGLAEATFTAVPGGVELRVSGAGESGGRVDWGPTRAHFLVDGPGGSELTKVHAFYEFNFMDIVMHGWVKRGVLVLAVFSRFRDGSGRSNHFDREFFYRAGD
jgi:hypothetical protein